MLYVQDTQQLPTAKRQKVEIVEKETTISIDRSTEVEDILSGKVLDTDIPGLEELMSTESKYCQYMLAQKSANQKILYQNGTFSYQIFYILLFLVFGPLMRLSPPPSEKDYCFNLDDSEGVCDLFDVQQLLSLRVEGNKSASNKYIRSNQCINHDSLFRTKLFEDNKHYIYYER